MSQTPAIDKLRRAMIAAGMPLEWVDVSIGLCADYAINAYKQGHGNGFNEGVEWKNHLDTVQPHGSPYTYESGDLVNTPLGIAIIRTEPDDKGDCTIQIKSGENVSASTFQFTKITRGVIRIEE